MLVDKDIIITDEKQIVNIIDIYYYKKGKFKTWCFLANIMNDHFVIIIKKLSLKPGISSKDSYLDFFRDHIGIKKIKEIFPKIVPNTFKSEPVTKDDIKVKYRNSM